MQKFWIVNKLDAHTADILLYGYISPYELSASDFVNELRQLDKDYSKINVRINSGGGDVFEGLAMYNALINCNAEVETWIDGLCGSMATIIAIAGKKVHMSKIAMFMTHSAKMYTGGNSKDLKQGIELLDGIDQTMAAIYSKKTGKPVEDCKTTFLGSDDKWFNAQQALEAKLIDVIFDADPVEIPAAAKNEKVVWNLYHTQRFAAKFNPSQNEKSNMEKIILTAASMTALGLSSDADQTVINAKILELSGKAAKVDTLTLELAAANTAKKKAEDDLVVLKASTVKNDVDTIITTALAEKRMTKEASEQLKKDYANNPEGLKALVATMKPYESVVTELKNDPANNTELSALAAKSGDELYKEGKLERLKEIDKEGGIYKAKYKECFGEEPVAETATK